MRQQASTLALAGIFQATELVRQVARNGEAEAGPFLISINSVLKLDSPSVAEVYGGVRGARSGLLSLERELGQARGGRQLEILRYVLGAMELERGLRKQPDLLDSIRRGLERAAERAETLSSTHPEVLSMLAEIYVENLSIFKYRIKVYGEPVYLEQSANVDKVRALLLAAVRSSVLWQQTGGRRWHLLLLRRRILWEARRYLEQIEAA